MSDTPTVGAWVTAWPAKDVTVEGIVTLVDGDVFMVEDADEHRWAISTTTMTWKAIE